MQKIFYSFVLVVLLLIHTSLFSSESSISLKCNKEYAYFSPPLHWDLIDPKFLSKSVKIGFTGKRNKDFAPSINLATEKVQLSLEDYVKAVKKLHSSKSNFVLNQSNTCRDLGELNCNTGTGRLLEIESFSPAGPVRLFQFIIVKDSTAYILTACHLKSEIQKDYKAIMECFKSFSTSSDPLGNLPILDKKEKIQALWDTCKKELNSFSDFTSKARFFSSSDYQKRFWVPLQNYILKECKELGPVWQLSVIEEIKEDLLTLSP